jgi:hypothetical protein
MDDWLDEEWRDIDGWPDYMISNLGRVWSARTNCYLRPGLAGAGYPFVDLSIRGKKRQVYVHRLVAEAFLGPGYGDEVNHIDGDRTYNVVWNLEWVSRKRNMQHASELGLLENVGRKKTPIRVVETGEVFKSQADCARTMGFPQGVIGNIVRGFRESHKGYHFEYVED